MNDQPAVSSVCAIDVVSDVVCPWCWIGKGQLDAALVRWRGRHPQAAMPEVTWHPFQLNPDLPQQGRPRGDYLDDKFGSRHAYPTERIVQAAERAGVPMRLDRIAHQPNTLRAHSLLGAAAALGSPVQHALADALFRAYFVDGQDIGDETLLRGLGRQVGLPAGQIDAAFGHEALQATAAADARARRTGVSGVPFFVIANRVGVSGAQGEQALLDAIEQAARPQAAPGPSQS